MSLAELIRLAESGGRFEHWQEAARAEVEAESRYRLAPALPELGWARESVGKGSTRESEDILSISQEWRLPAAKKPLARAIQAEAQAAALEHRAQRMRRREQLESQFAHTLELDRHIRTWREWDERIARSQARIHALVAGGQVAGYDARRIAWVRAETATELARLEALAAESWSQLAALAGLPLEPRPELLDPSEDKQAFGEPEATGEPSLPATGQETPADLARRMLAFEAEAARDRAMSLATPLRSLRLELGYKRAEGNAGSEAGYQFGIALPIPRREAGGAPYERARATQLESRLELETERDGALLQAAALKARGLAKVAADYQQHAIPLAEHLLGIAERAYEAGEAGILELLDAQRASRDARLRAIQLRAEAQAALIQLRYFQGGRP